MATSGSIPCRVGGHRIGEAGRFNTALDSSVKAVLWGQFPGRGGAAQADLDDAPIPARSGQWVVGMDRLMRLVERAEPDLSNVGAVFLGPISRCQNVAGQSIKGCECAFIPLRSAVPAPR